MTDVSASSKPRLPGPPKRRYDRPTLARLGTLVELTAGTYTTHNDPGGPVNGKSTSA